jgi:hypothetical protein
MATLGIPAGLGRHIIVAEPNLTHGTLVTPYSSHPIPRLAATSHVAGAKMVMLVMHQT